MTPKHGKKQGGLRDRLPKGAEHAAPGAGPVAYLNQEAKVLSELLGRGRLGEAEERAHRLLQQHADWASGWNILGACLGMQKKYDAAVDAFRTALTLLPNDPNVYNNLGPALLEQGDIAEAIKSFRRAVELNPDFAMAHMNLGIALRKQGALLEAEQSFRRALVLQPGYAEAHANLGSLYLELGKLEESAIFLEKAISLKPSDAAAFRDYAACKKFTPEDDDLARRLEELLTKTETDDDRSNLHFALGKICNDVARYDDAFRHYLEGNRIERKKHAYHPLDFASCVDRLIGTFAADLFRARAGAGSSSDLPVFILGMPRSGTTLVEQILSSHPLVHGGGELDYFEDKISTLAKKPGHSYPDCVKTMPTDDLLRIAEEYIGHLRGLHGAALRVCDKMPGNFLHLGFISLLLPRARVIHCRRNPLDTCLSIFFQQFSKNHPYSFDLRDLGHYYREYERLMEHWRAVLSPGQLLEVQYEELVNSPEMTSRKLIAFCGLEWDDRCLKFHEQERAVKTASSWQVRQPMYRTSTERWKKYDKHLGPLREALSSPEKPGNDRSEAARLIRSALAHFKTGTEGEALVREVLKTDKDTFDALTMLGAKEGHRGNDSGAEALFRHALTINAASAGTIHNLGLVLLKQIKLDEAAAAFRKAIALQPGFAMAHYNLGNTLQQQGKPSEAIVCFRRALELKSDMAVAHYNLGCALQEQGNASEAILCYRRAIDLKPDYAEALSNLGNALQTAGMLREAVESYERSLALQPDFAKAHNNLGDALQQLGKLHEAMQCYRKAFEIDPGFALAYRNYTTCTKSTADDKDLADRLEVLLNKTESGDEHCDLHFALGKIYHDLRMYDESFEHYLRGNQLDRKKFPYNRQDFSSYVDRVIAAFSAAHLKDRQGTGSLSELPVFILGMPRSGTTLTEQIISSHPLVYGAGELKRLEEIVQRFRTQRDPTYPECILDLATGAFGEIAGHYLDFVRGFSPDALRITDKMPGNFLHLGIIALLFPKARVIHCRRNPMDTCLSIFFQKFGGRHSYACDLTDLGHYYRDYERLMVHWRQALPPGMMLEIRYEDIVEHPEEMSRKLVEFCGLAWDDRCLKFHENERSVRTASSWQVRQPLYKTSTERWRKYEKHLAPLQRAFEGADN